MRVTQRVVIIRLKWDSFVAALKVIIVKEINKLRAQNNDGTRVSVHLKTA